jgi:hypothetical protein
MEYHKVVDKGPHSILAAKIESKAPKDALFLKSKYCGLFSEK